MSLEEFVAAVILALRRKAEPPSEVTLIRREKLKSDIFNYTAVRALGVNYQNTAGRPIMVITTVRHRVLTSGDQAFTEARAGAALPLGGANRQGVSGIAEWISTDNDNLQVYGTISFIVPPQWFYRLTPIVVAGGTNTMSHWTEIEL